MEEADVQLAEYVHPLLCMQQNSLGIDSAFFERFYLLCLTTRLFGSHGRRVTIFIQGVYVGARCDSGRQKLSWLSK